MELLFRIESVQPEGALVTGASTQNQDRQGQHLKEPHADRPPNPASIFTFSPLGGLIGRSAECDWVLQDAGRCLSGKHAAVSFEDQRFFITDISTNGLFINDKATPLGQGNRHQVKSGDRLLLGPYAVVATISEPENSIQADSRSGYDHLVTTGDHDLEDALELPEPLGAKRGGHKEVAASRQQTGETEQPQDPSKTHEERERRSDDSIRTSVPPAYDPVIAPSRDEYCDDALIQFLRGVGLDERLVSHPDIAQYMHTFGALLRSYTGELMKLMGERSRYKNHCRLDMTLVAPEHNNPLKYCVNEIQALREIVISPQSENLSGGAAVVAAMDDIRNHSWRVEKGYQGTLSALIDYFDVVRKVDGKAKTEGVGEGGGHPPEPSDGGSLSARPWQYRKRMKQLQRKQALLRDQRFYAEEFFAPRFAYYYQNPERVKSENPTRV